MSYICEECGDEIAGEFKEEHDATHRNECPCESEKTVDPQCAAAGMCVRGVDWLPRV